MSSEQSVTADSSSSRLTPFGFVIVIVIDDAMIKGKSKPSMSLENSTKKFSKSRPDRNDSTKVRLEYDKVDESLGVFRLGAGTSPIKGWLLNYISTIVQDESGTEKSGLDLYFIDNDGNSFKSTVVYAPYFYVDVVEPKYLLELSQHLLKRFEGCKTEIVEKEDLELNNHLSGIKHGFIKISFDTVHQLLDVRGILRESLKDRKKTMVMECDEVDNIETHQAMTGDPLQYISDLREYDVPYSMRCSIDLDIRIGSWFEINRIGESEICQVKKCLDIDCLPFIKILAFDIECEKLPLKFPNAENDRIYMISYIIAGVGYLIVNRDIVSEDIEDFEYSPKPKFAAKFTIFNEASEAAMLQKFISHIIELRPHVIVTYNGDRFDWPYLDKRSQKHNINIFREIGIRRSGTQQGRDFANSDIEYIGRCIVHLDALCWVKRDSYLPQGNHGLKAVTKCKLGYNPEEVDPEDMIMLARKSPHLMAAYSVSDAVATYFLYTTYVHNFIFSLGTIIPMISEEVLRKGSGTLCEALLMVEAYKSSVICPNKQIDELETFYNGHLVESETYIGGHVECLEAGVFRSDIACDFSLSTVALQRLIDNVDRDVTFALETENGVLRSDVLSDSYDTARAAIVTALELLRDSPNRVEMPKIYHLDVGAMYPNIILSNRLQPSAIVSQSECAACDFNRIENNCKRFMTWQWKGEFNPATLPEYFNIRRQVAVDRIGDRMFSELTEKDKAIVVRNRLKLYSQKVYNKTKVSKTEERISTVCMRENSFYVDTVRSFRDRRYEYKLLTKQWKNKKIAAEKAGNPIALKNAEDKEILMESLQIAHKCILNSFYGYVMRKGARWRSMEMAGIVTHTGAQLIKQARELIEQVGRPLELDTDGIWCILPASFPEQYKITLKSGSQVSITYPCAMLNADIHDKYTNHQYQTLISGNFSKPAYTSHSECSIFFEIDGPYKAMILPASPEEGVLLKKKYVVFNFDNSIAELKGFELKRRGELELVKIFQGQVFDQFLNGNNLKECYESVAIVANRWLDILFSKGESLPDDELMELISEKKTISKTLEDYDGRKATSLTSADRLADFLGADMVKDKGLNCNLVISKYPLGASVAERAIPVAIFAADPSTRDYYLGKWLKDRNYDNHDFRYIIDWDYYIDRLSKSIQRIITIPAAMQQIDNPCPRVEHPLWVKRILRNCGSQRQRTLAGFVSKSSFSDPKQIEQNTQFGDIGDIEDILKHDYSPNKVPLSHSRKNKRNEIIQELHLDTQPSSNALPLFGTNLNSIEELRNWLFVRKLDWSKIRDRKRIFSKDKNMLQYGRTTNEILFGINQRFEEQSEGRKRVHGIDDFVKRATLSTRGCWQIIELLESDTPGVFLAWVFTQRNMLQCLKIVVPRLIFVNCKGGSAEATALKLGGKLVKKDLPHMNKCFNLYEIEISEKKFIRNEKTLNLFLTDPNVEGVYECNTPLLFRLILKVGCVATVTSFKEDNDRSFRLNELQFVNTSMHNYLTANVAVFREIFIFQSISRRTGYDIGVVAIFFLDKNNETRQISNDGCYIVNGRCSMFIIQPSNALSDRPNLTKLFASIFDQSNECKFNLSVVNSVDSAYRSCNDLMNAYIRERRGPTIVVCQGGSSVVEWRQSMSALRAFPLIFIQKNSTDENFPAIGWQSLACKRAIERFKLYPIWLRDRLSCSNYCHVPVGNLGEDVVMTMSDVCFGRQLEVNRHLLWTSSSSLPDMVSLDVDFVSLWKEESITSKLCEPGMYKTVCVELELFGMCVASIMGSTLLDAQGLTVMSNSDASCSKTFNILKAAIAKWINDVALQKNIFADVLLTNLYRYLCGYDKTLLHDPSLHRIVCILMNKLFKKIINELKSLGAVIIYADFYKIILSTKRTNIDSAKEYLEFIINALTSKEVFQYIEIVERRYWSQLLWFDNENWAGITYADVVETASADDEFSEIPMSTAHSGLFKYGKKLEYNFLDEDLSQNSESEEILQATNDDGVTKKPISIEGHWDLAFSLPPLAAVYFRHIIDCYLQQCAEVGGIESTYETKEVNHIAIMSTFISERLTPTLLDVVDHLQAHFTKIRTITRINGTDTLPDVQNNRFIQGRMLALRQNVALSFVNCLIEVLNLDFELRDQIENVKRMLFTELCVKQFDLSLEFHTFSRPFILRDLVCACCNSSRDVDLLRDPSITGKGKLEELDKKLVELEEIDDSLEITSFDDMSAIKLAKYNLERNWSCQSCGHKHDVEKVEMRLLNEVDRSLTLFILQDLRCYKSQRASVRLMTDLSDLHLPLKMDWKNDDYRLYLEALLRVAEFYQMNWLKETIQCLFLRFFSSAP